ncbi:MAG: DUF2142 domain-containing protein [Ilumatobacteraceae bacterium]
MSTSDSRSLVWISAATAFAIVGCTWAFSIARYGGPDEPAHVIRAAAVAQGDLLGKPVAGFEQGYRQVTVSNSLASGDPACFRHDETITAACAVAQPATGEVVVATSAGIAPPWYYAIVGIVARVLADGNGVLAYRMAAVLLSAAILGYALARGRRYGGSGWMVVAFTPSAWFLLGVVGTSGAEIALVTLAVVEAVGRFHSRNAPASLLRVILPLSICLLLRPAALVDVALVGLVLIPTVPRPITKRSVVTIAAPVVAAGIASLAWSRWTGLVVDDQRTADSNSMATALDQSLRGIPTTVHQAIGAMGWNEFYAPVVTQVVWIAVLVLAIYWVVVRSSARWWHAWWIVAALLLPTVTEVALHRRIGEIWQGRYSIPFAMGGVLYAACVKPPARRLLAGIAIAAAVSEVLGLWHTLRRFMVGLDGSFSLQHAAWRPPLNPWLLLAVNAAAMAWLTVLALGSDQSDQSDQTRSGVKLG